MAARCRLRPARRRAVPGRRLGGGGIAADAGTNNCRAVDRESYPEYIRTVNSVSLISSSEAAREELEVLALHGEAALVGVRRLMYRYFQSVAIHFSHGKSLKFE